MSKTAFIAALLRAAGLALSAAISVLAPRPTQAAIFYVARYGADSTTCGDYIAPCRTLQKAIDRAAPGDTVYIEFVGNHGPGTITKSLNIIAVFGGGIFVPAARPCLTINAGPNDIVSVTGLVCDQSGTSRDGIVFNSGHRLSLINVDLTGGGGTTACAVRFQPNSIAELDFSAGNMSGWARGVCLLPRSAADISGVIDNVSLPRNQTGLYALAGTGSLISVTCDACQIVGGGTGITSSGSGSTLRIRNSSVAENKLGLNHPNNGKIVSLRGNSLAGNTTKGTLTSTVPPL